MQAFGITVYLGDEPVRQYVVEAKDEDTAADYALEYVRNLIGYSAKEPEDLDGEPDDHFIVES